MPADSDDFPISTSSRLWWAVPGVGLVLLALFGLLFGSDPEKVDFGTSYDASSRGFRAVYLLMEELKYPAERSRVSTGGNVRWVLYPTALDAKEGQALDGWVNRGGLLLLAGDDPTAAAAIGLTITVTGPHAERGRKTESIVQIHKESIPSHTYPASAPDVTQLIAGDTEVVGPPGGRVWGWIEDKPLVTIYPHGRGEIWLLNRPDVLVNEHLRGADNAVLASRLAEQMLDARPGARLTFDEYCHGLRDRPSAVDLLFRPPVLGLTLQFLLVAAVAVWYFGVRFGPVRPTPPPARRSKEEFLDAMAELLVRKGDRADAFRSVRDDFRRRVETNLGLPAGTRPELTAQEAARRRGVNPGPLLELLIATAPPAGTGGKSFLAAIHQMDSLSHECFTDRPRAR